MANATHDSNSNGKGWALLGGLGLGALVMFLVDPQAGRRRRARLRDQATHAARKIHDGADVVARDARNRLDGLAAVSRNGWQRHREATTDDVILMERVRSALGRVTSHPHAIQVGAHDGHVVVSGVALSHESHAIVSCVRKVPGVRSVEQHLDLHDEAGRVPSLQGGSKRQRRAELLQDNWSPAWRSLAGAIGAGLAVAGWIRGGIAGLALGGMGGGLAARAATNRDLKSLVGVGDGCKGAVVHKSIHIDAPVDEVYRHWAIESFPRWMSHVREVRPLGGNRHRWIVDGPAHVPVEWESEITSAVDNQEMSWRSVAGSTVDNAGRVRFMPENGGTRVQVALSYVPPGGMIGHAIARALGADPKSRMDDDLMRFKSMIETGRLPHDAAAFRRPASRVQPSL